jgi:hypothetical protein
VLTGRSSSAVVAAKRTPGQRVRAALWAVRVPVGVYLASRLLVLLAAAAGGFIATTSGRPVLTGPWPVLTGTGRATVDALLRWDSAWYVEVATRGYSADPNGPAGAPNAFFPLFPALVRWCAALTGLPPGPAGLVVAFGTGLAATVLVWLLARQVAGTQTADRTAALFAFFPGAFVFSMVYSEGLLVALAAATLLALGDRRWLLAGVLAAATTATRPNGAAIGVACAWAAWVALRERREWRALVAPALAPAGILAFFAFLAVRTGDPLAWFTAQREAWSEKIDLTAQVRRIGLVIDVPTNPEGSLNTLLPVLGGVVIVVALVLLLRWRPSGPVVAYTLTASAIVLVSASIGARPRMLLAAFPLVMALAHSVRGSAFAALLAGSAGGLATLMVITASTLAATP